MGLIRSMFDAIRKPKRANSRKDATFGDVWQDDFGVWRANTNFKLEGTAISIFMFDLNGEGPGDWQRERFVELGRRYASVKNAMEILLFTEYERIRKDWQLASKALVVPQEIWQVATLVAIEIYAPQSTSGIDFSLDHQIQWENDDHDLNVRIKDWQPIEVAMEG